MLRVTIAPQRIEIAAPLALIFEMAGAADYGYRPQARYTERAMRQEGQRLLVQAALRGQAATLKELIALPPDRVRSRHLSGPVAGAIEELQIVPTTAGTQATLTAEFWVAEGVNSQVRKLHLEHQANEQLLELRAAAHQRVGGRPAQPVALPWDEPLPALVSEQDLRHRAEAQEEEEFGHSGHGGGVARIAVALAEVSGLAAGQIEQLRRAAILHDVGKVALDAALWGSRGTLSSWQRTLMEAHVLFGHELVRRAGLPEAVTAAILHHHERWDGRGYPGRLAGAAIPVTARLLGVAEALDSMLRASYRRQALAPSQAAAMLAADADERWDPAIAQQALRHMRGGG